eukprot:gb/GECH01010619.1/.p1 GENE.gb/GECH01010619.1/~~gb/GECH01010619.1/.p1  ORF type:complete len:319 (+),score=95.69 gb/GECH01010619.1/:1-957(+)
MNCQDENESHKGMPRNIVNSKTRKGEVFLDQPQFHKDDFEWNDVKEQCEDRLQHKHTTTRSQEEKEQVEEEIKYNWEKHFNQHKSQFYPVKNYIFECFPELKSQPKEEKKVVAELGCGHGSTLFPMVRKNPHWHFIGVDFSETAISLLLQHEISQEHNVQGIVCDLSQSSEIPNLPPESVDIVLMVFMLSAVPPDHRMEQVIRNAARVLKPGGQLLFRDFGLYDMSQMRIKNGRQLSSQQPYYYVRGDGTTAYFFSKERTRELFCGDHVIDNGKSESASKSISLAEEEIEYHRNRLVNRKTGLEMYRVFIHGKFRRNN